jgi:hypothetical protein
MSQALISCSPTPDFLHSFEPPWHRIDQPIDLPLVYTIPRTTQGTSKCLDIKLVFFEFPDVWKHISHLSFPNCPDVLNWVQIWAVSWPERNHRDSVVKQPLVSLLTSVNLGIVLLEVHDPSLFRVLLNACQEKIFTLLLAQYAPEIQTGFQETVSWLESWSGWSCRQEPTGSPRKGAEPSSKKHDHGLVYYHLTLLIDTYLSISNSPSSSRQGSAKNTFSIF